MIEFQGVDPSEMAEGGELSVSSRDEMLGTISNILKTKEKYVDEAIRRTLPPPLEGVMPEIQPEKLAELFERELESLGCKSHRVSSTLELEEKLCTILGHIQAQSVVLSRNPLLYELQIDKMLERRGQ